MRKCFIDDDDVRFVERIVRIEGAPLQQRHPHRLKIIGRHALGFRKRFFARFRIWPAGDRKRFLRSSAAAERRVVAHGNCADTGQSGDSIE